jgi:hypothetical protein
VDPTNGSVYVVDRGNHRVEKFSPEGQFELMFGGDVNKDGSDVCKAGEECQAGAVASAGEEGEGKFHAWHLGSFIAVGATGTVYVGDEDRVQEFNSNGVYQGQIKLTGFGTPTALAVNASGDIFVRAFEHNSVHEFEPSGAELHDFIFSERLEGVGVDPVTGDVYIAEEHNNGAKVSAELFEYEGAGAYSLLAERAPEAPLLSSGGVAVGRHGTVYVTDGFGSGSEVADKVAILGNPPEEGLAGAPAPSVGAGRVLHDAATSAQVSATVSPHFQQVRYYVQYGSSTGYEDGDAPAPPGLYLAGRVQGAATVTLEGLAPGTEYHYRFVAESENGEMAYGPDATFVSDGEGITGLPDGRVYEQVSPPFKNGNYFDPFGGFMFGLAEADGDGVVYEMNGAVGSSYAGIVGEYVSRRAPGVGWSTQQATPRPLGNKLRIETASPWFIQPSADFGSFLFAGQEAYVEGDAPGSLNLFLSDDPAVEPVWLGQPTAQAPIPAVGANTKTTHPIDNYVVAGASADLGTVYFAYAGTLLPEDEGPSGRAAHIGNGLSEGDLKPQEPEPWGFYEYSGGELHEAGALPDGALSAYGAIPAALGSPEGTLDRRVHYQDGGFDNTISENGARAFFVSPDPDASSVTDPEGCKRLPSSCTSEVPELYMREALPGGERRTVLVSRSQLPGSAGEPAADGPALVENYAGATYAFATPDGSHVFFASVDRLTEAAPTGGGAKEYELDVESEELTYLPGVVGPIAAVSPSASDFMFVNTSKSPKELEVWRSGADGGSTSEVAKLTLKPSNQLRAPQVRFSHASRDGSTFVFETTAEVPGFNDAGVNEDGPELQLFRYETGTGDLECLSCGPKGVEAAGNAFTSYDEYESQGEEGQGHLNGENGNAVPATTLQPRAMSANGRRVFFDTPTPLVAQAVNGKRDVYEWEADGEGSCATAGGCTYLISSGAASGNSFYLDNSESGGDVFFATSAGLAPGDTDEAYDVYDARIPRPGDSPPPSVPPCKGSVCQGPPPVPQLLDMPPSETFSGPGNPAPAPEVKPVVMSKAKAKAKAKKKKKKKGKKGAKSKGKRGAHGSSAGARAKGRR